MVDRLLVLLSGEEIGVLDREDGTEPVFRYMPEYVTDGQVALSSRLPLQSAPHPAARIRPYLAGLLPEDVGARRAWASRFGVDANDAFALLARMGWDCPGAVQFCREEDLPELHARSEAFEPSSTDEIGNRIRSMIAGEPSWTMEDEHWSLGGQQQKFALTWLRDGWHTAQGSAATTHIVKPGISSLHHQALLEHITMTAATALGVDAAATEFTRFGEEWAIVIERFDRVQLDDRIVRIHQEDFAQACGRMPTQKYESDDGPTLVDMVRTVKRESTDLQEDRLALADFLAFNLIAGAPDGHAKNIALLRLPGVVHVAPLFDLATGLAYDTANVDRSVALSVGGERAASRIHRRQWERAARTLEMAADTLITRVAEIATQASTAFEDTLTSLPDDAPGRDAVAERLLPAVERHAAIVLERL